MGKVAVTQADRDRAHDAMKAADICGSGTLANVKMGRWDENAYVQAFAATRIATAEACARIAEGKLLGTPRGPDRWYNDACEDIATAIRLQQGSEKP